jgi:hypothetical protein
MRMGRGRGEKEGERERKRTERREQGAVYGQGKWSRGIDEMRSEG